MNTKREQKKIATLFANLMDASLQLFPEAGGSIEAPDRKGVYVIYSPGRRVLHVGSTPRAAGGLRQRLRNHMEGKSSFMKKWFLREERKAPQLRGRYLFQCLAVPDPRQRALLEALAIGRLCPGHIGHGLE